ncbi:helix-turn-helix domain-containing protein [Halomonas sp. HK25]|uniref:AraC family transcriptional regulator n=1 Tax=Halomonas sp. HK25 TaxID=3394321 RepID=UPI0039FBD0FE
MHPSGSTKNRTFLDVLEDPTNSMGTLQTASFTKSGITLAQHRAPAHRFSCGPTSDLVIIVQQNIASSSAQFDLGWGWREHFCAAPTAVYVIPPQADVRWEINDESQCIYFAVPYDHASVLLEQMEVASPKECLWSLATSGFNEALIHELVHRLWRANLSSDSACELLLSSYKIAIIHALSQRWSETHEKVVSAKVKLSKAQLRYVLEFIRHNLGEPLSVESLAHSLRLSPFHFARMFKNSTGHSPYSYVQSLRIDKAKDLLTTSPMSVSAVADRLGFSSQSYFSRAFKAKVGCSPDKFRRRLLFNIR